MVLADYGQRDGCRGLYIRPAVVYVLRDLLVPLPGFRSADPAPSGYS